MTRPKLLYSVLAKRSYLGLRHDPVKSIQMYPVSDLPIINSLVLTKAAFCPVILSMIMMKKEEPYSISDQNG